MAKAHRIVIDISKNSTTGKFEADVQNAPSSVKPLHAIYWRVKRPLGFPTDAEVYIEFFTQTGSVKTPAAGPFQGRARLDGVWITKQNGKKVYVILGGFVDVVPPPGTNYSYKYQGFYSVGTTVERLFDPEIVVEGDPDEQPIVKGTKKKKAKKKAKKR